MTTTRANPDLSETDALREDLEMTRQHLADTLQELSRQLNVPRRLKESATSTFHAAGHRAKQAAGNATARVRLAAGGVSGRAKAAASANSERTMELTAKAKQVPAMARQVPELTRKHPRAAAAVGGAAAVAVGATAWIMGRSK